MSVAVYKDIGALTGETDKVEKMYDPEHVRTPSIDDAHSPVIFNRFLWSYLAILKQMLASFIITKYVGNFLHRHCL